MLLFLVACSVCAHTGTNKSSWPGVDFTYSKIFVYNLDNQLRGNNAPVKDAKLDPTIDEPGKVLTAEQTHKLLAVLNENTQALNAGLSACYEPHHAIVFYNKNDSIVASASVCFLCEGIRLYPQKKYHSKRKVYNEKEIKQAQVQLSKLKQIIQESELPFFNTQEDYSAYALSKNYKDAFSDLFKPLANIKQLLKELNYKETVHVDSTMRINGKDTLMVYTLKNKFCEINCAKQKNEPLRIFYTNVKQEPCGILQHVNVGSKKNKTLSYFKQYQHSRLVENDYHVFGLNKKLHLVFNAQTNEVIYLEYKEDY